MKCGHYIIKIPKSKSIVIRWHGYSSTSQCIIFIHKPVYNEAPSGQNSKLSAKSKNSARSSQLWIMALQDNPGDISYNECISALKTGRQPTINSWQYKLFNNICQQKFAEDNLFSRLSVSKHDKVYRNSLKKKLKNISKNFK